MRISKYGNKETNTTENQLSSTELIFFYRKPTHFNQIHSCRVEVSKDVLHLFTFPQREPVGIIRQGSDPGPSGLGWGAECPKDAEQLIDFGIARKKGFLEDLRKIINRLEFKQWKTL